MYIVMEIQANGDQVTTIVNTYAVRATADQKYHTVLAAAAVSSVQIHSAVILSADGKELERKSYIHEV